MNDEDTLTFIRNNIFQPGGNFKPFPNELKSQICGPISILRRGAARGENRRAGRVSIRT